MKKKTKLTTTLCAAAVLTLGASLTSMAASKGTWRLVDGEWMSFDRNGDAYENTFVLSNGKEYYVGDDGLLVRSDWVEYEGDYYFVNSAGEKIINDWRYTSPYDDASGEEGWYWFQANGKMATDKKLTYKGGTYYIDSEGRMMTGWITANSDSIEEASAFDEDNTYYLDENGVRLQKAWIYTTAPGADEDDDEENYYYLKSNGKAATGKQNNIKGQTYFFGEDGKMLSGWIAETATDSNAYEEIDGEDSAEKLTAGRKYYYGGAEDDGHMKKNKWIKLWAPEDTYEEDYDADSYWYWIAADGEVYVPDEATDSNAVVEKYKLEDGKLTKKTVHGQDTFTVTKKKINSKDYFFNQYGEMQSDFLKVVTGSKDLDAGVYYFGDANDGAMKTGATSIKDDNDETYRFYFYTSSANDHTKGQGVTGNQNGKLYYDGMLISAEDSRYQVAEIDGHQFIVNQSGSIQHSEPEYKEDGDVLIDARVEKNGSGQVTYKVDFYKNSNDLKEDSLGDQWKYSIRSITGGSLRNDAPVIDVEDMVYDNEVFMVSLEVIEN